MLMDDLTPEEIQELTKEIEVTEEDEYKEYNDKLYGTPYVFGPQGLRRKVKKGNLEEKKTLSNFMPLSIKKIYIDNGLESEGYLELEGVLYNKNKLPKIKVNYNKIDSMLWLYKPEWDLCGTIYPPKSNHKEYVYDSIQALSRNIPKETIFEHTGFRKVNGQLVYLHQGGAIGTNKDIRVDLSSISLERYKFTDKMYDINECIRLSLSIIDLGNKEITIPLLALTYLAPLRSLFLNANIPLGFVTWILGESGTQKSSFAALLLSHFGDFERDTIPCGFKDTVNSLEKQAFIIKDSVMLVDDYYPSQSLQESRKLEAVAESIFGMAGDKQGRTRMKQNGKDLRKSFSSRGIIMATGETFPDFAESRVARSVIVEIEKGDMRLDVLSFLQKSKGNLNIAMREYIRWIIQNYDKVKENMKNDFPIYRAKFNRDFAHARIPENMASLYIGCKTFFEFAKEQQVIKENMMEEWLSIVEENLLRLAKKQSLRTSDSKPDKMFFYAIQELVASGEAYFKPYLQEDRTLDKPYSTFLGCYDSSQKAYYLIPGITYKAVVEYYGKQNMKFPLNQASLWKYLKKHDALKIVEGDRNTIRRKINKESIAVLAVAQEKISEDLAIEK